MDNDHSGEVIMNLKGRTLTLRPSLAMIRNLERRGIKLMPTLKKFATFDFGLQDMANIVVAACTEKVSVEEVEELIFKTGFNDAAVVEPLTELLRNACSGGKKPEEVAEGSEEEVFQQPKP